MDELTQDHDRFLMFETILGHVAAEERARTRTLSVESIDRALELADYACGRLAATAPNASDDGTVLEVDPDLVPRAEG